MREKILWRCGLVLLAVCLSPLSGELLAATVVLNWTDTSNNESGFKIERMPSGGSYSQITTVASGVQSFTDNSVVAGASYCYRVSAYNSSGTSSPSNSVCTQVPSGSTGSTGGTSGGSSTGGTSGTSGGSSTGGTTPTVSYIGSKWKNYKLSVSLRPQNSGDVGIMFRYLDMDNYYRFLWDADSKVFRLEERVNGVLKVLASRSDSLTAGGLYPIELYANGSTLTAYLSGKSLFSVSDTTLTEGQIALYTASSANAGFDNLVVTDLPSGNILLQDNFSSTAFGGWTVIDEAANGPSRWSISGGLLVQSSAIGSTASGDTIGTFALFTQSSWTDYRLSLTMKSTDDDGIGVMFRVKDDKNYYRFSWHREGGSRRLEKRVNGTFTTLASQTAAYTIGQNYSVTIVAQGTTLQVSLDGQMVFSVTDSSFNRGTIALHSRWNRGAIFDNVLVEDLKNGSILLWDNFNDGNALGWTIMDDAGTTAGPSNWFVNNGTLVQDSNIGSNELGTFVLY